MSNPVAGANYLLRGFGLLFKPGIRVYVIIPILINTLLFAALIGLGIQQFTGFLDWLMPELPDWLHWLSWLMWLVFAVGAALILFFTFSLLANLVGAPFNSLLAQAVEKYLRGPDLSGASTEARGFLEVIIPAMSDEIKKILYFVLWSVPFLILFLIPMVNLAAPVLWFLFTAWMLALEYADFPLGNHNLSFTQQRSLLRSRTFRTMGFGSAVGIATMIPIANFMVMPAAVAGATIYWVEQLHSKRND